MTTSPYPDSFDYTGDNAYLDALIYGGQWSSDQSTVTLQYAARSGTDPYNINGLSQGNSWAAYEIAALAEAMQLWENVANIDLVYTTDTATADLWYWKGDIDEVGALGWHEVPTDSIIEPLYGVFADNGTGWTTAGLQAGGYGFVTLLHEIGHGLGLAHPHPDGSGSSVFPGVTSAFYSFGDYDLNQGIYTLMGYNDGWPVEYANHSASNGFINYGYSATPMAFDIAAVQAIYGANMSYKAGDNTYVLPSQNAAGTGWSAIWDAGGTDTISAEGSSLDYRIDLRAAPLTGENAGGYVSYSAGIVGGFTIANGVVIEDAIGGSGDDWIRGNAADNTLIGNGGSDTLIGGAGDDTLSSGQGADVLVGSGADVLIGGAGEDLLTFDTVQGRVFVDLQLDHREAGFIVFFDEGAASGATFATIENLTGGAYSDNLRGDENDNVIKGGAGDDRLYGRAGDDTLVGGFGSDSLYGGMGADVMTGGNTADVIDEFLYFWAAESAAGSDTRDVITDFVTGEDKIDLTRIDALSSTSADDSFIFIATSQFSGAAGELGYRQDSGDVIVQADLDGDGTADFEIFLEGVSTLSAVDFYL